MKKYLSLFFVISFVFILSACFPDSKDKEGQNTEQNTEDNAENNAEPAASYSGETDQEYEATLKSEGWVPGVLKISISSNYKYAGEDRNDASGGTTRKFDVLNKLNVNAEKDVLVAPDLTKVLPDYTASKITMQDLGKSLFYASELGDIPASGSALYQRSVTTLTPNANEYTEMNERTLAQTAIDTIHVDDIEASSYGAGYQTSVSLSYKLEGESEISMKPVNGNPFSTKDSCCDATTLDFYLYPTPSQEVFSKVEREEDDVGHDDIFQTLLKVDTTQEMRLDLHTGLAIVAQTPEKVVLRYAPDPKLLPLAGDGLTQLSTDPEAASFVLEISVERK